jgi:hypothetical protein
MAFAAAVTLAVPEASVTAVVAERFAEAPLVGTTKATVAPGTGLPEASLTRTASGAAKGVLIATLCPEPTVIVRMLGGPAVFVSGKEADAVLPFTEIEAVTL